VSQRVLVGVEGTSVLAGELEVVRRLPLPACQSVMVGDLTGNRPDLPTAAPAAGECLRDAPVQESPPPQTGLFVHQCA
jgi:hypothetical protein